MPTFCWDVHGYTVQVVILVGSSSKKNVKEMHGWLDSKDNCKNKKIRTDIGRLLPLMTAVWRIFFDHCHFKPKATTGSLQKLSWAKAENPFDNKRVYEIKEVRKYIETIL